MREKNYFFCHLMVYLLLICIGVWAAMGRSLSVGNTVKSSSSHFPKPSSGPDWCLWRSDSGPRASCFTRLLSLTSDFVGKLLRDGVQLLSWKQSLRELLLHWRPVLTADLAFAIGGVLSMSGYVHVKHPNKTFASTFMFVNFRHIKTLCDPFLMETGWKTQLDEISVEQPLYILPLPHTHTNVLIPSPPVAVIQQEVGWFPRGVCSQRCHS